MPRRCNTWWPTGQCFAHFVGLSPDRGAIQLVGRDDDAGNLSFASWFRFWNRNTRCPAAPSAAHPLTLACWRQPEVDLPVVWFADAGTASGWRLPPVHRDDGGWRLYCWAPCRWPAWRIAGSVRHRPCGLARGRTAVHRIYPAGDAVCLHGAGRRHLLRRKATALIWPEATIRHEQMLAVVLGLRTAMQPTP